MTYIFLADGFEEVEAIYPIDLLRRAGVHVTTVGVGCLAPVGRSGIKVTADISEAEFAGAHEKIDMLILPGGAGVSRLEASEIVNAAIDETLAEGGYIAAICAAPTLLAKRGLLKGMSATCFPDMRGILEENGARHSNAPVMHHDQFITSQSIDTAEKFAKFLVYTLTK